MDTLTRLLKAGQIKGAVIREIEMNLDIHLSGVIIPPPQCSMHQARKIEHDLAIPWFG